MIVWCLVLRQYTLMKGCGQESVGLMTWETAARGSRRCLGAEETGWDMRWRTCKGVGVGVELPSKRQACEEREAAGAMGRKDGSGPGCVLRVWVINCFHLPNHPSWKGQHSPSLLLLLLHFSLCERKGVVAMASASSPNIQQIYCNQPKPLH